MDYKTNYNGSYGDRKTRYEFLLDNFKDFIHGNVLDVGCDEKYLKSILDQSINYVGIDITGNPDIVVDIESIPLPFEDKEFDVICCLDVLEHLNDPYSTFDELSRISNKFIIISLPNNYYIWERLRIMRGMKPNKYYGLPISFPSDRHKWFFNIYDATEFIKVNARSAGFRVVREFPFYKTDGIYGIGLLRNFLKKIGALPNLFAASYWAVMERQNL